ncbi:MAG: SLATT domain-containing protein [Actinobacteria bacterium]|nr:SLATT domain-containing protein [Actinomycetota bacterium]
MSEPQFNRPDDRPKRAAWDERTEGLLREWHDRAAAARSAHYLLASRMRRRNIAVGVPAVVLSAVVGTSLFATLSEANVPTSLRVTIGLISLIAAVLAALQTFFGFSQRAERHVIAGDWYSAIRRQMEETIALPEEERDPPRECLDGIRKEMSKISQQAPEIGQALWRRTADDYGVIEAPKAGRTAAPS